MSDINEPGYGAPLTPEEILAGGTQGGVAPPPSYRPHEDDGTVDSRVPADLKDKLAALPPAPSQRGASFFSDGELADAADGMSASDAAGELRAARAAVDIARADLIAAEQRLSDAEKNLGNASKAFDAAVKREHGL